MNARTDPSILSVPELCFATVPSGICVPYVISGSGEPLVFVHGSLCDYRYWSSQTDFLSKHFLCISVSLSHYWPADDACIQGEFGWKTHVAELAEFIVAMDLGPVHLVGHSRGGCVAFHVAREYPRLVKTLTLADPGGPLQIDGTSEASLPPATNVLRAKVADLIESGAIDTGLELFVDSVSMPGFWRKSPASFRTMAIDNAATLPKQFCDPLPAYSRVAARDVKCRTLLIEGEKSPRMFRNNVEKLADWIDYADKQTIAGASHGMTVAKPGVFNRLVHAFVSA
ncbi:(E)-2-((N-methylformamido)methylene)succinate hydrolase [Paraburkholderia nemoris]|uniref:alpha/beta fold hydrolase n=1 Tax=Paraburkholderia nemoris TaxID=2793076 RepID=UPI0019099139|nr:MULTISPECIES: alpha/beta hydrolase [Paraburkholderia]MBK3786839.1 alpha/beta hydrolase [Paraburkholderia aspalathi]CAE6863921.1 (E)-2-((N-methylformamido)methylene)succinate hydrolase [Paraburkholderia nemoris]